MIIQTFLMSSGIGCLLVIGTAYLLYQYANQKKLEQANLSNQVAKAKFDIEENTLAVISKKLHDDIQPDLIYAKKCLTRIQSIPLEQVLIASSQAYQKISMVIDDIRNLSRNINSTFVIQNGLWYSVEHLLKDINSIAGFSAIFNLNGNYKKLDSDKELILFRIVQEAITNSLKYSRADQIIVTLDFAIDKLILIIKDNGIGFNVDETLNNCYRNHSSGLKSMVDKTNAIKAKLDLYSEPGQGTTVLVTTPYKIN